MTAYSTRDASSRSYTGSASNSMPASLSNSYTNLGTPGQQYLNYGNIQTSQYASLSSQMSGLNVSGPTSTGSTPVWTPDPRVPQPADDRRAMSMVDAQQIRDEFNRRKAAMDNRPQSEMITVKRTESDQDIARRFQQEQERRAQLQQFGSTPSLQASSIQATVGSSAASTF